MNPKTPLGSNVIKNENAKIRYEFKVMCKQYVTFLTLDYIIPVTKWVITVFPP